MKKSPPQRERTCSNCLHYKADEDGEIGECRRHPPVALYDPEDGLFSACPPVTPDGWCGEHSAKH